MTSPISFFAEEPLRPASDAAADAVKPAPPACEGEAPAPANESASSSLSRPSSASSAARGKVLHDGNVKLVGSEGVPIVVETEVAEQCAMFRRMLAADEEGNALYKEGRVRELKFPSIRTRILQKVVDYLTYRRQWNLDGGHNGEFQVESDIALELMLAANYLGLTDDEEL
ncbi:hypothetical protein BESB_019500 [Besnoitia besnoiti]|uniref:Elongin-C n=1 Tax=Besnoitia besnoiti TaxID=94643 RepID=A0A2A9M218_BESBE|nr:hypothetical protein BESB_019500 [Besnoitia besnoiti]PFH32009.1 hypothetical protein BESB_019500 [Besnoitia besnoiti]